MTFESMNEEQARIANAVRTIFSELRSRQSISILDVTYWLGMNINIASKAFTGQSGYSTGGFKMIDIDILETEGCTNLVTTAGWSLNGSASGLPDVEKLSELLPGITLVPEATNGRSKILKLKVVQNLDMWNNLVFSSLYWLISIKNNNHVSIKEREHITEKINSVLAKYSLKIDHDVLKIAADLGLLEEEATFVEWFTQYANQPDVLSLAPPIDMS